MEVRMVCSAPLVTYVGLQSHSHHYFEIGRVEQDLAKTRTNSSVKWASKWWNEGTMADAKHGGLILCQMPHSLWDSVQIRHCLKDGFMRKFSHFQQQGRLIDRAKRKQARNYPPVSQIRSFMQPNTRLWEPTPHYASTSNWKETSKCMERLVKGRLDKSGRVYDARYL